MAFYSQWTDGQAAVGNVGGHIIMTTMIIL